MKEELSLDIEELRRKKKSEIIDDANDDDDDVEVMSNQPIRMSYFLISSISSSFSTSSLSLTFT